MSNRGGGSPARREKAGVPDEVMLGQLRDACWHISERIQGLEQRAEAVAAAEPAGAPPWSEKSAESIAARALVRNWKDDESNPLAVCLKRIDVILGACSRPSFEWDVVSLKLCRGCPCSCKASAICDAKKVASASAHG
jgi:hypothetical protein